ncbi:type II toxin-antitoxin system HicB family antitoxin [Sphingomonas sp.]|jgi:antitoxin HicB|uniref:type II toxin-antitoxin system HicB family antitoxin n=1 Tax=Sphingomonas sp. TaxID=28214 RepID=UPI002E375B35|nr:type II toxin-antitoxin system HicB family antitoxin [Sphingomonas sp.]HEX4695004.1 type II toxin-antitoxin system HicB family antitoxin [Sphingomonas sp.]
MEYTALFTPSEDGGFVVTFPDFDWGVTQGDTEGEALDMAADALGMMIGEHIRKGEPLPAPRTRRGAKYRAIRLPALHAAKAELYRAFLAANIRKSELARRLNIPKTNVDRLFDLKHQSRLDQIEAAFQMLGKELVFTVKDAA